MEQSLDQIVRLLAAAHAHDAADPDFDARYDARDRAVTILMTDFFMDYLRALYSAFDGDVTAALVLGEIGQANVRRFVNQHERDALPLDTVDDDAALASNMRSVNAFSAALASGVPRETTRRKINALVEKGWLERDAEGGYVATAAVREHFVPDFNRELCRRLLATADRLRTIMDTPVEPPAQSDDGTTAGGR